MDISLRMKSWQVFILLFVLPALIQILYFYHLVFEEINDLNHILRSFSLLMLVFMVIYMFWFWAQGIGLNNIVPRNIRPGSGLFRFSIIYTAVYSILFQFYFLSASISNIDSLFIVLGVLIHILGIYCGIYMVYFIARSMIMAEKKKIVEFSEFSSVFILLGIYPIGLWFIQPRINTIYEENKNRGYTADIPGHYRSME